MTRTGRGATFCVGPAAVTRDTGPQSVRLRVRWHLYDHLRIRYTHHLRPAWEAAGRPQDFRLMTAFNQAGAADQHDQRSFRKAPRSERLSASSPDHIYPGIIGAPGGNLMNQPNEGADGGFMEGVAGGAHGRKRNRDH